MTEGVTAGIVASVFVLGAFIAGVAFGVWIREKRKPK